MAESHPSKVKVAAAFGTLGIVFGDIGTSPLYVFRESFEHADLPVSQTNAYGVASVVFWALIIIISVKYLLLVMRADNHGEGGILALTALVMPRGVNAKRATMAMVTLGVFGTALLYGDGLITPAISVLSAVEGFEVATSALDSWVIPIAIVVLIGLFLVQPRGTERIARVFSPVMLVWFAVLAVLGLRQIIDHPEVIKAAWPGYAIQLFADQPGKAFFALGSIFLVVTGGEALYADMGHFGRRSIQLSWYSVVLPALLLNYFGQAALLASRPASIENPFYELAPDWAVVPLVLLATMATVIASQALITGAFSLTVQAIQLDYFPRLAVRHTSASHHGQVYVPLVNWLLMIGCIALVLGFETSSNLAAAYGIAVTMTMVITTLLFHHFVIERWGWSQVKAGIVIAPLLLIDLAFFSANIPKIPHGGWFPLLVGFVLVVQMTTWRRGRQLVASRMERGLVPLHEVITEAMATGVQRPPGTAVYLFKGPHGTPPALISNIAHNRSLHELTLVVSVATSENPRIADEERVSVEHIADRVYRVGISFGFMEEPNVAEALKLVHLDGAGFDPAMASYFIGRETVTPTDLPGMPAWREHLFEVLSRGAASAARFFGLPPDRVFEVGTHVEI